jgi:hypothetical protein
MNNDMFLFPILLFSFLTLSRGNNCITYLSRSSPGTGTWTLLRGNRLSTAPKGSQANMATDADYKRLGAWARMLEPDQQIDRHTSHRTVPMDSPLARLPTIRHALNVRSLLHTRLRLPIPLLLCLREHPRRRHVARSATFDIPRRARAGLEEALRQLARS